MSGRRGAGRRGGGGGGDYPGERQPEAAPAHGQRRGGRGGRGHGDGGRGRDGSRGGGGRRGSVPSSRREDPSPPPRPPADLPPSSSSSSPVEAASTSLSKDVQQRLTITEVVEGEASTAVAAPAAPPPPPASSKAIVDALRPGFGTVGRRCVVRANHFLVEVAGKDLVHYDVTITPEPVSKATNRKIISELVKLHKDGMLGRRIPAYDGMKSLYTAGALPFEVKDFIVKLPGRDQRREKQFKVSIKHAGCPDLNYLREFLSGRQTDAPQEVIQALDVVLRQSPSSKYTTVARSFFSPLFGHRTDIGDGLECWRGYYQSLRPTQMGLCLNIDISAASFYKPVNVVEFVAECLNLRDLSRPLSDLDRSKIKKALRGVRVEATHRRDLCIRYRITGITSMPMRQLTFPIDEQKTMKSVVQYFRERYNFSLKYVSWPCLQAGNDSRPIYLPMEVCKIVEGQRFSRKLNVGQVTEMLKATRQLPHAREESILKMVHHNNYNNDEYTKEFGIRMKNELTSVEARVLPAPKLKYHDSGRERTCSPSVGQWNMINKILQKCKNYKVHLLLSIEKMVNGGTVEYWTCLSFSLRLREDEVYKFCSELIGMCNKIGMVINPRPFVDIQFANPHHLESTLREMSVHSMEALKGMGVCGKNLQLLIVVLPEKSGVYGRIKRICETELGIVSQCCMPKHVFKCDRKYLENVALKINVKAGGRNTVLEDALYRKIPLVTDQPTIIFGADVTHPPPGEDSSSSIAAVVASIDWPEVTKYRGLFSAQQHRQEMIQDLFTVIQDPQRGRVVGGMIRELLVAFYRATNRKPHRIIFYRDGVSEGQFSQVLLYEMDAIGKACASLQDGYLPTVTFVVVQKRHHTRLFPEVHGNRDSTDKSGNILPGTVVDKKICHPTKFDFYLCSHAGIQGTSRPTHYHVLLDENKFSADGLQMLTNNLCYTYARCTRSVSIVPPVYYAHLAAYRARYYMEDELSEGGSTSDRTRDRPVEVCRLPQVKDAVKEVMFYC